MINLIIHIIVQHIVELYIIYVYSCKLVVAAGKRGGSNKQQRVAWIGTEREGGESKMHIAGSADVCAASSAADGWSWERGLRRESGGKLYKRNPNRYGPNKYSPSG